MNKKYLFIPLLFLVIYLLPLGVRPLLEPGETRYAEIPREMIATSDWIVPRLDGMRYFEKPPMGYWLGALSQEAFGETNFAARFSSAMAAGITALFIYMLAGKWLGRRVALLASAIYLTFVTVYVVGTINALDSVLTMFLTGTLVAWYYSFSGFIKHRALPLILCGLFCGCAFLTKGFIALVLSGLIVGGFLMLNSRWRELTFRAVLLPLGVLVLVVLPWSFAIHQLEPDFWNKFFWIEHVGRFLGAGTDQHPEPIWYFLPGLLVGALPWTVLMPAAIYGLKQIYRDNPLYGYLFFWFLVPFVFFSLSTGKLFAYILPCFVPLSILLAAGLSHYLKNTETKLMDWGSRLLAVILALLCSFLVVTHFVDISDVDSFTSTENGKWIVAVTVLLFYSVFLWMAARMIKPRQKLICFAVASLPLLFANPFLFPAAVLDRLAPEEFLKNYQKNITADTILISHEDSLRAVCWYYQRDDVYVLSGAAEFGYGLSYEDASDRNIGNFEKDGFSYDELLRFIEEHGRDRAIVLIAPRFLYEAYAQGGLLPKPVFIDNSNKHFVLAEYGNRSDTNKQNVKQ